MQYDRSLLVADPRRMEPKKCGGKGARSKMQKAYRWFHFFKISQNKMSQCKRKINSTENNRKKR